MTSILKIIEQVFAWIMVLPLFIVFAVGVVPIFQKLMSYDYIGSVEYSFSSELHPYEFLILNPSIPFNVIISDLSSIQFP